MAAGAALCLAGCSSPVVLSRDPSRIENIHAFKSDDVRDVLISPDSTVFCLLMNDDSVRTIDASGREAGSFKYENIGRIAISDGARRLIMAGKTGRRSFVRITTLDGRRIWSQRMTSGIVDVAISGDGDYAWAVTDDRRMLAFDLSGSPRWRRLKLERDVTRAMYNPTLDSLLVRTNNPPGFGFMETDGKMRWWNPQREGIFTLRSSVGGTRILTTTEQLSPVPQIRFDIYNFGGRRVFTRTLEGYEPRAALSADGEYLAASYRRKLVHEKKSVMERKVVVWDMEGKEIWVRGGLFLPPVLASISSDPLSVTVAENYTLLTALDTDGKVAWRGQTLSGRLSTVSGSDNWSLATAKFKDGSVELWRLK